MKKKDPKQKPRRCLVLRKILNIMKLTTLLFFVALIQVSASSYSQTRLNLKFEKESLESVFSKIEGNSEFSIFYKNELIKNSKDVSGEYKNASIFDILDDVLKQENLSYTLKGKLIMIVPKNEGENQKNESQQKPVSGKVTDSSNVPLPGVTVMVKGTVSGTITDNKGNFLFESIPANATLQFSFVGMKTREVAVENKSTINVTMEEESVGIDEVVAIGYGTAKKSDLTGSVSAVSPDQLLKRHPVTMEQGLQGMTAGVQVTRTSGSPAGGASVRIRGTATINNSAEPLYVVDGIMVGTNVNFLNPNDIEAIEVLKDASATAIYGARGANGVIMITTKKGIKGQAKLTFDASFGLQNQTNKIDVANAEQFATAYNQACTNDGFTLNPVWTNPSALTNINWQDEMARKSLIQQYNFSALGGTEKTQAMMSIGYLNNEGIVRASEYKRITARANVTHTIKDIVRTGLDISFMHAESRGVYVRPTDHNQSALLVANPFANYVATVPTMDTLSNGVLSHVPIQYPDGTWGHFPREGNGGYNSPGADNPVAAAETADALYSNNRVLANAFFEIDLLKGLTFKTVGGINYIGNSNHNYEMRQHRTFYPNPTDDFYMRQNTSLEYILESYFTYNRIFGKNRFTALLGNSVSKGTSENIDASSTDFAVNTIRNIGLTQAPETIVGGGGLGIPTREQSLYGRIMYSYADRYLLTATVRRDGSSNFGAGNKYGTFPSLSLGWRISEEDFMQNQNIFSNLKLRTGWGQTGNAGFPTNLSVDQLSNNRIAYYFYDPETNSFITGPGLAQLNEIDTNLKWETNEQLNIGFDMSFLENALSFTADYFRRDAKDLLLYKGLRPSTGFSQVYTNAGQIRNTGFEFQIGYQKKLGDWDLNVNANATTVKNETVDVGRDIFSNYGADGINDINVGAWWNTYSVTRNGYPVGSYYGLRTDGIFQTQAEIDALNANAIAKGSGSGAYQSIETKPGDRKYQDIDGNGWIDDQDRTILGDGYPDFTYGLNVSLGYKNFDFNAYFYGVAGQDILSYSYHNLVAIGDNVIADYATNAWDGPGSTNVYPRLTRADPNHNGQISDAFILNGDFLKVQNVQLGYTFPKKILSSVKMESARVFVSVENLLTISKYKVGDPEVGNGNVQQTGFDGGKYPFPQIYTFGINFGF